MVFNYDVSRGNGAGKAVSSAPTISGDNPGLPVATRAHGASRDPLTGRILSPLVVSARGLVLHGTTVFPASLRQRPTAGRLSLHV